MRLNHHGNFKVQRFQPFEQIKKDDCAPSPTFPYLKLISFFRTWNIKMLLYLIFFTSWLQP